MNNQLTIFDCPTCKVPINKQATMENVQAEYFNTTNAKGEKLKQYKDKANSQSKQILEYFELKKKETPPVILLTPSMVHAAIFAPFTPLTSIRARMTTLKDNGYLEMTKGQREGIHGRPEHLWRLI